MKILELFGTCTYKPNVLCKKPPASLKVTFWFLEEAYRIGRNFPFAAKLLHNASFEGQFKTCTIGSLLHTTANSDVH